MSSLVLPASRNGSNGHAEYAPPHHPERMQKLMDSAVVAINEIGKEPTRQIEELRAKLQQEHEDLDADLGKLIEAINKHTEIAHDRVAAYIERSTAIREGIKGIQQQMKQEAEQ